LAFLLVKTMERKNIPEIYVKENLGLDKDGELIWITKKRGRSQYSKAGFVTKNSKGVPCCRVTILGEWYSKSSLVWFIYHGAQVEDGFIIDHLDGDPLNNQITNLCKKSIADNNKNKKMQKNNSSGITGVCMIKGLWHSTIGKKKIYAGNDFFEACCIRRSAELSYGLTGRHGR
jgi:HNH endonuclease